MSGSVAHAERLKFLTKRALQQAYSICLSLPQVVALEFSSSSSLSAKHPLFLMKTKTPQTQRTVNNGHVTSLVQRLGRNVVFAAVLDNHAGCAVEIGVDIEIVLLEVAPHQQLVLLPVTASNDKVVLRTDKPEKLFKPVHFARLAHIHRDLAAEIG